MEENKMFGALISIIVPVYNVEAYLSDTIISVMNQDYSNWELLLIDDGSTDKSAEICENFAEIDKRIKVYHTLNKGVSHARNVGIRESRGEYIVFCDSDDIISPLFLSTLKDKLEESGADIARCDMRIIDENVHSFRDGNCSFPWEVYDSSRIIELPESMYHVVWGKMYKKHLIANHDIVFDESMNRGEDTLFAYETTLCSSRIIYSDNEYVNYRVRHDSLMRSKSINSLFRQNVHKYNKICDFIDTRSIENADFIRNQAFSAIIENLITNVENKAIFNANYSNFCNDKTLQKKLKEQCETFPRRWQLIIKIMSLFNTPQMASLVRLSCRVILR